MSLPYRGSMTVGECKEPPTGTTEAVLKASSKSYCENLERVRGYTFENNDGVPSLDYKQLLDSLLFTGFQATQFGIAVNIVNDMLNDRKKPFEPDIRIEDEFIRPKTACTVFLAYTSNMISSGIREHIRFLVKNKLVDCIVTTAGGIEEDLIKCLDLRTTSESGAEDVMKANTFVGNFKLAGSNLREHGINRIGNLLVPNDNYCRFEDWLLPILDMMLAEQNASHGKIVWSPSKFIERLGIELDHHDSVCYWAAKNKIPIFCPAITDGSLGDMLHFHTFRSPGLILDIVSDIKRINTLAHNTESFQTGAIILGGGVAKHHTMNANLMRNGTNYTVFINTAAEFDGSDSGAEPDEAVSWGKVKADARSVKWHLHWKDNRGNTMNGYEPGDEFQCLSIPIKVAKTPANDPLTGLETFRSGFSIAGGIDQDHTKSPQKFTEAGVYITKIDPNGAGARAGLKPGDRILQCNGHDFTLVTHRKAVEYIKKYQVLDMLIIRKDDCVNV